MDRRTPLGLAAASLAALAWMGAVVSGGADPFLLAGTILLSGGFVLAAWGAWRGQARMLAAGVALAGAGVLPFYRGDFLSGAANLAGLVFLLGAGWAALGFLRGAPGPAAMGLLVASAGCAVWIWSDLQSPWLWGAGDVAMLAACATAAWGAAA